MKKILPYCLLISLLLAGCMSQQQEQEVRKALQAVGNFLGGEVQYKVGVSVGTEASKKNIAGPYAELEIKNSPLAVKFKQLDLLASHAAYLFYDALSEQTRRSYASVRVTLVGENSTSTYNFSTFDLHVVREAAPQVAQVVAAIKDRRYGQLGANASPEAFSDTTRRQIKQLFADLDAKSGRTLGYQPYGFLLTQDTVKGRPVLLLRTFGELRKEKNAGGFCIITEPGVPVTDKYLFGFELY